MRIIQDGKYELRCTRLKWQKTLYRFPSFAWAMHSQKRPCKEKPYKRSHSGPNIVDVVNKWNKPSDEIMNANNIYSCTMIKKV